MLRKVEHAVYLLIQSSVDRMILPTKNGCKRVTWDIVISYFFSLLLFIYTVFLHSHDKHHDLSVPKSINLSACYDTIATLLVFE